MTERYDPGLKYGEVCHHEGILDEGAIFMFIHLVPDSPWAKVLVLRGDYNNFREGQIVSAHHGLVKVENE